MKSDRQAALEILLEVENKRAYSNLLINKYSRKYQINESAFIREIVYGVIENKIFLDYVISLFVKRGFNKLRSEVLTILRMGLYQLIFLTGVPPYAAVNESVQLARKYSKKHSGFVNAVMRNYMRSKENIPLPERKEDIIRYFSIKYSYEPWMIEEWLRVYPEDFTESLLIAGNKTPEVTVRLNGLKTNSDDLSEMLFRKGFEVKQGRFVKEALIVKGKNIIDNEFFRQGFYQVQDESSMMAVKALSPEQGDRVLDICAAPGGKTIFAGELMADQGRIVAHDIHSHKIKLIDDKAKNHDIHIIESHIHDALIYDNNLVDKFDKVLADVPCSGLGVIRRKPEIKYNRKKEELKEFTDIQYHMLKNAGDYVRKGGTLVYSTCTIYSSENEGVIRKFLSNNQNFIVIKPNGDEFKSLKMKDDYVQLFPNIHKTDGFFICKMLKKE